MQHLDIQRIGPPVAVAVAALAGDGASARAFVFSFCVHVLSPVAFCVFLSPFYKAISRRLPRSGPLVLLSCAMRPSNCAALPHSAAEGGATLLGRQPSVCHD